MHTRTQSTDCCETQTRHSEGLVTQREWYSNVEVSRKVTLNAKKIDYNEGK